MACYLSIYLHNYQPFLYILASIFSQGWLKKTLKQFRLPWAGIYYDGGVSALGQIV
jgi:hypothetical protein